VGIYLNGWVIYDIIKQPDKLEFVELTWIK
jgi:hypothetical protein